MWRQLPITDFAIPKKEEKLDARDRVIKAVERYWETSRYFGLAYVEVTLDNKPYEQFYMSPLELDALLERFSDTKIWTTRDFGECDMCDRDSMCEKYDRDCQYDSDGNCGWCKNPELCPGHTIDDFDFTHTTDSFDLGKRLLEDEEEPRGSRSRLLEKFAAQYAEDHCECGDDCEKCGSDVEMKAV